MLALQAQGRLLFCLFQLPVAPALWLHLPVSASVFTWPSLQVVLSFRLLSLIQTTAIGFRAWQSNPASSQEPSLITPDKTRLTNKVTGSGMWPSLLGMPSFNPLWHIRGQGSLPCHVLGHSGAQGAQPHPQRASCLAQPATVHRDCGPGSRSSCLLPGGQLALRFQRF